MAVGQFNANARRLMRDTTYPQTQKGTETAHGTDHHPARKQYAVKFMAKGNPVSFLKSLKIRPTLKQSKATKLLHNTNRQFPVKAINHPKGRRRIKSAR